ncbi:MAG: HEAT repeat domain-containing protein, partial [Acidobacteriota bacterium]|nr:HEAT repeat domain-containing protein [Acidobacteriota bacterium]
MINEPLWGITRQGYGTGFQARTLNEAQSLISTLSTDKRNPQKALRCRQSSRLMIRALLLLVWCASSSAFIVYGQTTTRAVTQDKATSPSDARLSKLPPALRERGLALLNESGEKERARLADDLAKEKADSVMDFLLSVLKLEPSATVRSAIIDRLGRHSHPQIQQALEHHAASDADATVSILALEKLRLQQTQEMEQILTRRLEMARRSGDQRSLRQLAQEHER